MISVNSVEYTENYLRARDELGTIPDADLLTRYEDMKRRIRKDEAFATSTGLGAGGYVANLFDSPFAGIVLSGLTGSFFLRYLMRKAGESGLSRNPQSIALYHTLHSRGLLDPVSGKVYTPNAIEIPEQPEPTT